MLVGLKTSSKYSPHHLTTSLVEVSSTSPTLHHVSRTPLSCSESPVGFWGFASVTSRTSLLLGRWYWGCRRLTKPNRAPVVPPWGVWCPPYHYNWHQPSCRHTSVQPPHFELNVPSLPQNAVGVLLKILFKDLLHRGLCQIPDTWQLRLVPAWAVRWAGVSCGDPGQGSCLTTVELC